MRRKNRVPGCIFSNHGRYWWQARLPGERKLKARSLAPEGGTYATSDKRVAEEVARRAMLKVHDLQPVRTRALTGTHDCTKVEVEFDTEDQAEMQVNCLLGGWGLVTGKAWFDDLCLEKIGEGRYPKSPAAPIETDRPGQVSRVPGPPPRGGHPANRACNLTSGDLWGKVR